MPSIRAKDRMMRFLRKGLGRLADCHVPDRKSLGIPGSTGFATYQKVSIRAKSKAMHSSVERWIFPRIAQRDVSSKLCCVNRPHKHVQFCRLLAKELVKIRTHRRKHRFNERISRATSLGNVHLVAHRVGTAMGLPLALPVHRSR